MSKPWRVEDLTLTAEKALQFYRSSSQIEANNAEIYQINTDLTVLNNQLEEQVQHRTEQLRQSIQELEVLSQLKDDFLHAISHDLRTPVAGMLMVLRRHQTKATLRRLPFPSIASSKARQRAPAQTSRNSGRGAL